MKATLSLDWCGKKWLFCRPANLEALWENLDAEMFQQDERLPYWVELWPASLALVALLQKQKEHLLGKVCLDVGCGLGFTALAGALYGARVLAFDYEREALVYAKKNADLNGISGVTWAVMDWRQPAVQPKSCDIIWAGDIMYEQRFIQPVFSFLQHALKPSGKVWVAEPQRNIFSSFTACLRKHQWEFSCIQSMNVPALHEQKSTVSVDIWQLTPPAASMRAL